MSQKLKSWLPAIVWALLIMVASTDAFSAGHTRTYLEGFFHWLFPSWTPYTVYKAHLVVRKCAHFFEYAVLAIFVMRGLTGAKAPQSTPSGRVAEAPLSLRMTFLSVVLLCAMVATVDEVHQHFVPSRTSSPYDVLLDTSGSTFAMLLLTLRKRRAAAAA